MNIIDKINSEQLKSEITPFKPGDTVRVHTLIQEGTKERVQVFEGVVLRRNGGGIDETFTVRKVSHNVGVERIFPLHSPRVQKIEVKTAGRVRRARIYYLRELSGKAARIKGERRDTGTSKKKASKASADSAAVETPTEDTAPIKVEQQPSA